MEKTLFANLPSAGRTQRGVIHCESILGPSGRTITAKSGKNKKVANAPAPYRGLSGPSGPKCRKSLENVSRGLRPRNPEKSPKSLGNSPKRLFRHTLWRLSGLFPRLFGDFSGSRGRRPRETFSRLFRHLGPEGPERPL